MEIEFNWIINLGLIKALLIQIRGQFVFGLKILRLKRKKKYIYIVYQSKPEKTKTTKKQQQTNPASELLLKLIIIFYRNIVKIKPGLNDAEMQF